VVGEPFSAAQAQLTSKGFTVSQIQVTNAKPSGTVIAQDPLAGGKAKQGSNVSLTVSSGPGSNSVPTMVGETLAEAKSALQLAGLKPGNTLKQSSTSIASGHVIDSSPAAGTSVPIGSKVTLVVSTGPPPVQVPDVTGEDVGQAKATLQGRNFNVNTTDEVTSTASPGTVLSQSPVGNKNAAYGSTVNLVVAKAPPTVAIPNVVGKTRGAAEATLGAAGFPATPTTQTVTNPSQNNVVLSQNPAASTQAKKNTNVTIVVGKYVATPTTTTTTTTPTTPTGTTSTHKKKK
jgi:serine/threonine-protein kinase